MNQEILLEDPSTLWMNAQFYRLSYIIYHISCKCLCQYYQSVILTVSSWVSHIWQRQNWLGPRMSQENQTSRPDYFPDCNLVMMWFVILTSKLIKLLKINWKVFKTQPGCNFQTRRLGLSRFSTRFSQGLKDRQFLAILGEKLEK